jgi:hypothetical protein
MSRRHLIILALAASYWLLVTSCSSAIGQAGTDIAILQAGVGARALGMGGAFTAVADNADAPYWNPAGLGRVTSSEITTMQTRLSTDTDHYYVSYVQPAFGGTLGISWVQVALGNISQTSAEVDYHNEVQTLGIFSYFSNAYLLSYGKDLSDKVSVGLTAKYLTSDIGQLSGGQASGYSLTPGVLLKAPRFTLGLKVDELFNEQRWGTGTVERVPPKVRLGLAYQAPNPGLLSLDISQTVRSGYSPQISLGYEAAVFRGIAFRAGYAEGGFSAGAGFAVQHAQVDYAYVNQPSLSRENVHRISLSGVW